MQDVTNLAFWHCLVPRGGPDIYVTEYFRVHPESRLERFILDSIEQNPTGRPVVAQMIGDGVFVVFAVLPDGEDLRSAGFTGDDVGRICACFSRRAPRRVDDVDHGADYVLPFSAIADFDLSNVVGFNALVAHFRYQ